MCVPPIISVQNWHWLQWDFSAKTKKVFYFLTKVLCSCHLYVLVVWRVFVFFPFQKILPFDMTLSLPLNNNMSHTEGILLFCGHHVKELISSNKKYIHSYGMENTSHIIICCLNRSFDKKRSLLIFVKHSYSNWMMYSFQIQLMFDFEYFQFLFKKLLTIFILKVASSIISR